MMIEPLGDGGIAHYAFNLIDALSKEGADVLLFTNESYEFNNERVGFVIRNNMFRLANRLIKIFPYLDKEAGFPAFLRRLIKLLEYPLNTLDAIHIAISEDIKIVHLQSVNLIEILMVLAFKLIGKKIAFTIHNINPKHKKLRLYHKIIYRAMYGLCDFIIIHSENGRNEVIDLFRVNPDKIYVVPHGDYKFFVPSKEMDAREAKSILGLDPDVKTILFFGAIRDNKGLENILRAMPIIRKRVPKVKLLIVGEPWEDYTRYKKIIEKERIEGNILEKLDYITNEDVPLYFYASDIVVLPYHEITGSGILQIAYAFSKPVVASDLDGFRETIENGKNGFLVKIKDYGTMAAKICDILLDDSLRMQMGSISRNLSDTRYNWNDIAKKTLHIYNQKL